MSTTTHPIPRAMALANAPEIIAKARARGWIAAPAKTHGNPMLGPAGVTLGFEAVSPDTAAAWLRANTANRRLRPSTVARYARDMRMGAWLINHQGIAFREDGVLLDGQHRLQAVVDSGVTITFLVTRGWPARIDEAGASTTLDTVDTGAGRSIADLLELQHGQENPRIVTSTARLVAEIVCWPRYERVRKSALSIATVLLLLKQMPKSFQWVAHKQPKIPSMRQASIMAVLALIHAHQPAVASDILGTLVTGAGLSHDSPLLHLRNWLMVPENQHGMAKLNVAITAATMIFEYLDGKTATEVSAQGVALRRLTESLPKKVIEGIRGAFDLPADLPVSTDAQN